MKTERTFEEQESRDEQAEDLRNIKSFKRIKNAKTFESVCREIVEESTALRFKGMLIDHFSASAFIKVYDAINDTNKEKLAAIGNVNPSKAMGIVWQLIK